MTPKEKARELVDNFRLNVLDYEGSGLNSFKAKKCALISVDELLSFVEDDREVFNWKTYYEQVKEELEKL